MTETVADRLATRPPSVGAMLLERVRASGPDEAFRYLDGSRWVSLTWTQLKDKVFELAAALLALGLRARGSGGDRLQHPDRVDSRRPRHHVRRRRDDDGLSDDPARGRRLHHRRLGVQGGLRRGRRPGRQGARAPRRAASIC